MKTIEALRQEVETALRSLPALTDGRPTQLYAPVVYTLEGGGKRIRPVLALAACQLFGKDTDKAVAPALGLEIFHNFTLLHDDIMDRADKRRGRPTVHVKWNANTAILSGDAMFALASALVGRAPAKSLPEVMAAFHDLALGVCEGQQYDMNFETQERVEMSEYMEMIRLKTAVLLAGALKIGALIGEAPGEAVARLYNFGIQIGLAFQLQDDLLDLYGDEDKFGKKIGSDIRENKKTFLYLKALETLSESGASELRALFRTPTTEENEAEKISRVCALYAETDVKKRVEDEINRLFARGRGELSMLTAMPALDPDALETLNRFIASLLGREY